MYFRDADNYEVDVVIENAAGQLVGVEVKASATVKESDLRGLKKLASLAGDHFKIGILLYDGDEIMPLGSGIWAAPLSSLWGQCSVISWIVGGESPKIHPPCKSTITL